MAKTKAAAPKAPKAPKAAKSKGPGFDFKKLFLERGERIGLYSAGGITLLLLVLAVMSGFSSGSSSEKAESLIKPATWVENELVRADNVPGPDDKPKDAEQRLVDLTTTRVKGDNFRVASLVPIDDPRGSGGRRNPKVLSIDEGAAAVARVQVKTFMFAPGTPPKVYVLKGEPGEDGGKGNKGSQGPAAGGGLGGKLGQGNSGGGQGYPPGMMGGGGDKGAAGAAGKKKGPSRGLFDKPSLSDDARKGKRAVAVSLDADKGQDPYAMQVRPLRMAVIAAAFPFRKQVEEFRARLGLRTVDDVLKEGVRDPDETTKEALFAFRFLGVEAQRRELDRDGLPVVDEKERGTDKEGWETLDLNASYLQFVVATGRDFEADDAALAPITQRGLVMPRLKQFRSEEPTADNMGGPPAPGGGSEGPKPGGAAGAGGSSEGPKPGGAAGAGGPANPGQGKGDKVARKDKDDEDQYPSIEKALPLIKKTLDELEAKDPSEVVLPSRFQRDKFDVFDPGASSSAAKGSKGDAGMLMPSQPVMGGPNKGGPEETAKDAKPRLLPEYCLVRLVDVDVQPGKTYEYRLRVKMANPNFKRTDAASPSYSIKPELPPGEWSKMPIVVRVDAELNYYAINQESVEKQTNKSARFSDRYTRAIQDGEIKAERHLFFQAHRWMERVNHRGNPAEIGEWAVAERFPVARGEYVGRPERIAMPMWRYDLEDFVIATDSQAKVNDPTISVNFGYDSRGPQPEAILVDFEQGRTGYHRAAVAKEGEKVDARPITDVSAGEALLLLPDGRLMLRETARDAADETRDARLKKVKARARDVKSRGQDPEKKDEKDKKDKKGVF